MMATTYEFEESWRAVGVQIKAAMDTTRRRTGRAPFLAEHDRQAAQVGVGLIRSIPEDVEVDLTGVVGDLGERVLEHTRFLSNVAHLDDSEAECLMAATRRGFVRFLNAFRDTMLQERAQTREQIASRIEAMLAVQPEGDVFSTS